MAVTTRYAVVLLILSSLALPPAGRGDDTWSLDQDGFWDVADNWLGGTVPDGVGARAYFLDNQIERRTVYIQDEAGNQGNDDNEITLGEIHLDDRLGYVFHWGGTSERLRFDNAAGPALIHVGTTSGHARHFFSTDGYISDTVLSDDLVVVNNSAGALFIRPPIDRAGHALVKKGRGLLLFGREDFYMGDVTLDDQGVFVDGGTIGHDLTTEPLTSIGPRGATLNVLSRRYIYEADTLVGAATLFKTGDGEIELPAQPRFSGDIVVREGTLGIWPQPRTVSVVGGSDASVSLRDGNYAGMRLNIGSKSSLIGASSQVHSLVQGENLFLAPDSVVVEVEPGGNRSIVNQNHANLLFGFLDVDEPQIAIGPGTPWKGLSGSDYYGFNRATYLNANAPGTVSVSGDFVLQHYSKPVVLGNTLSPTHFVSSSGRHTATIIYGDAEKMPMGRVSTANTSQYASDRGMIFRSRDADMSGIGKIVVTPGASLQIPGKGMFGTASHQVPLVELQAGSELGSLDSTSFFDTTADLGDATFRVLGPAAISLRRDANTGHMGGRFVFENERTSSLMMPEGVQADAIEFKDDAGVRTIFAGARLIALGTQDVTFVNNTEGGEINGRVTGSGTLRKGWVGNLTFSGDLSGFRGPDARVIVDAGMLSATTDAFATGPDGPTVELRVSDRHFSAATYAFGEDVNAGLRLTADSQGVLAIRGRNTNLSGVNGSFAFVGADGDAELEVDSLAPGAMQTYRLGGGPCEPVLKITPAVPGAVLSGANDLVIGMPQSRIGGLVSNGAGTVVLNGFNDYTGDTTINAGSTLRLMAGAAIGGGEGAGAVNVLGRLEFPFIRASLGRTGPIQIYGGGSMAIEMAINNGAMIPDDTPFALFGGTIEITALNNRNAHETVGPTRLESGHSRIVAGGSGVVAPRLTITQLERTPASVLTIGGHFGEGEASGQVNLGNVQDLLVHGIIPWVLMDDESFATLGERGLVPYSDTSISQVEGSSTSDNVASQDVQVPLSANTSINSLRVLATTVDMGGQLLSVGGESREGRATGGIILSSQATIGTLQRPGFLTSGQAGFAMDSATPGELLFAVPEQNAGTVNAAIIDNAGADGVFGNDDDLAVSVVKAGPGRLVLNNADSSYSGGTHVIDGTLQLNQPIPGAVHLVDATLELHPPAANERMTIGEVIIESSPLKQSFILTPRASASDSATWTAMGPLTVRPGASIWFGSPVISNTRVSVEGPVDVRGGILRVGQTDLARFGGAYIDDIDTTYVSDRSYQINEGAFEFDTGQATDVRGTFYRTGLHARGEGTELRFHGRLLADDTYSSSFDDFELSAYSGKVTVMPEATLQAAAGWMGTSYVGRELKIRGDSRGEVEFRPGFRLMKTAGTNNAADVGTSFLNFLGPVTWVTHERGHLPNFDQAFMATLPPNVYPGHINVGVDGWEWQVRSNPQSYNQKIDIAGSTQITTHADLSFSQESFVQFGYEPRLDFVQFTSAYPNGGAIRKLGPADLAIEGRMSTVYHNVIEVMEGRLIMNNRSAEGTGTLDVFVGAGGLLFGGNSDGSHGTIPGQVTVESGGRIDPGNGIETGILTVRPDWGGVVMEGGSAFEPTLDGPLAGSGHDQLKVLGEVRLGEPNALPILTPQLSYAPGYDELLFIVENDLNEPITGRFAASSGTTLEQGASIDLVSSVDGQAYRFEVGYSGDAPAREFDAAAGNDVVLRNVPIGSRWSADMDGNWSNEMNWLGQTPATANDEAYFGAVNTTGRSVTVDVPVTLGRLGFNSPHSYSIDGSAPITFDVLTGDARLQVVGGRHAIHSPVVLADDLAIAISPAESVLSLTGGLDADGKIVTKTGTGTLALGKLSVDSMIVEGGTVELLADGGPSVFRSLSLAGGAQPSVSLDLNNNAAIMDYTGNSTEATVRQQVVAGRGGSGFGAEWDGSGITSSAAAAANAEEPESRSVGYAENSALPLGPYSNFYGQPVDDTSILMAYTRTGDANLDGVVDDADVTIVSATYAPGIPQPHWALGDFDYNGFVDDADVTLLGAFYDPTAEPLFAAAAPIAAAVPEPGTAALFIAGLAAALVARTVRRKRR